MVADWQLPPGVSRGLWEYVHDGDIARNYDAALAHTPLLTCDALFVREHCPAPGRLIDLGCGSGRLSVALAREGFWCLAVDLSEEMLRVVAAKAEAARVEVPRLKANLVDLGGLADGSFDYAASLFHTLGMIDTREARRRAVAEVHRLLRPGGTFILHVHNRWFNAWTRQGRRLLRADLWRSLLGRQRAGDYLMPPHQGIGSMPMHLFTRREAVRLLVEAGFAVKEIRPVSIEGFLKWPRCFAAARSFGYLIAATRA